jgi:hypothetical protein
MLYSLLSFHFIGPPIITQRNISLINGKVVLSIYVFSDPRITDIIWMREISGKTTYNGSARSSMESIRNTTSTILSYGVRFTVQGQRIEFNIVELNVTREDMFVKFGMNMDLKQHHLILSK